MKIEGPRKIIIDSNDGGVVTAPTHFTDVIQNTTQPFIRGSCGPHSRGSQANTRKIDGGALELIAKSRLSGSLREYQIVDKLSSCVQNYVLLLLLLLGLRTYGLRIRMGFNVRVSYIGSLAPLNFTSHLRKLNL